MQAPFDDIWRAPGAAAVAPECAGRLRLDAGHHRASELPPAAQVFVQIGATLVLDQAVPAISFVSVDHGRVEGRLSQLSGLQGLSIYSGSLSFPEDVGLVVDATPSGLVDVIAPVDVVHQLDGDGLRRVKLFGLPDLREFALPAVLRWLSMTPRSSPASALRPLEHLERLVLTLELTSVARVKLLGHKPSLAHAEFFGPGLRSLDGAEDWSALQSLVLHQTGVADLDPVTATPLEQIHVVDGAGRIDFAPLSRSSTLQTARLRPFRHLTSLGPDWSAATSLRSIEITDVVLGDRALDGLALAPGLKAVATEQSNAAAVRRLQQARPDIEATLWDEPVRLPARQGTFAPTLVDGRWCVTGDVAGVLGVATNHDAEKLLRDSLAAAVLASVEFDSEADAVAAFSDSRDAIDAVAAGIEHLRQGVR